MITGSKMSVTVDDELDFQEELEISMEGRACRGGYSCCGGCADRSEWLIRAQVEQLAEHLHAVLHPEGPTIAELMALHDERTGGVIPGSLHSPELQKLLRDAFEGTAMWQTEIEGQADEGQADEG